MSILLERGEILIFKEDCLKSENLMNTINEYSTAPLPKEGSEYKKFETAFGVSMNGNFSNAFIFLRNFPDPFMKVVEVSLEGNVIFAQYPATEESTITRFISIENNEPIPIPHSIQPFYMYYKAHANSRSVEMVVGTPMDPVFEDLSILTRRMSPTPLDPSEEMEWWDWARLHMHGNYECSISDIIVRLLFSLNCYDPVDYAEARIRYVNGTGEASKYKFTMHDMFAHQNPSLSSFPSICEFPYVAIILKYDWVCKQDPFDHYIKIKLPEEFRTEEGIIKNKNNVIYDSFDSWRSSHVDCVMECIIGNESTDFCTNSQSSIMFDPLSTSWMVKLIKFMDNPPLQLHLGKSYKYLLPRRKQYDVIDISKAFQLHFVCRNQNILFSNGLEDNNLVNVKIGFLKIFIYLDRDNLPDKNLLKMTRKKEEHIPINMNCSLKDIEISVNGYTLDDKFNFSIENQSFDPQVIASVGDVSYYMDSTKSDSILQPFVIGNEKCFIKQITPGFEHQLLIADVNVMWSARIRDAVMILVDVAQQFMFDEFEVAQRLTLTKIKEKTKEEKDTSSEKQEESKDEELLNHLISGDLTTQQSKIESKEKVLPFFSVTLINATGMLIAEESDECLILKSNAGTVEVNKITDYSYDKPIESHEIQALIKNMTGNFRDTNSLDYFAIIKQPITDLPLVIEKSDWIVRFIIVQDPKYYIKTRKPEKQLHIEVPDVKVIFSSSNLQTLIDIITNTLVPKKLERTVTLQDRFATIMFNSKLDPDSLGNCGAFINKCETIRKKIRSLESQLNLLRREASVKLSSEIVASIDKIEIELKEQKALYHGMNKTLQKNVNQLLSRKEEESIVDMIINITLHSLRYEMIDKNSKPFAEFSFQLFKGSITKNKDYSIFHNYTLHQIIGKNKLPNPIYEDLLMPYQNSDHDIIEENDYMVRVLANTSKPVAGIKGFDHLEIDLSPLHLQLTFEFNQKLWSYLFPLSKQEKQEQTLITTSITPSTSTQVSLERRQSTFIDEFSQSTSQLGKSPSKLKHQKIIDSDLKRGSFIWQPSKHDSVSDIDEMKHRAKTVKVFNYIRMQEVQLFVSLMGVPDSESQISKYVRNFEKVKIHIKPITYNQVVMTWQDFFETLKYDIIKQSLSFIVPETVKSVTKSKISGIANILNPFSRLSTGTTNQTVQDPNDNKITRTKKIQTEISKSKIVDSVKDAKLKILFGGKKETSNVDSRKQLFGKKLVEGSSVDEKLINEEDIDVEEEEVSKDEFANLLDSLE